MLAVLNEALREYPPVTIGLPRVAPRGGGVVDGNPVPEGVSHQLLCRTTNRYVYLLTCI